MSSIQFIEYDKSFISLLDAFNKRISKSGRVFKNPKKWQYYEGNIINQKFYVLIDHDKFIRAICAIKNQMYLLKGTKINFQDIQLPLSESVVDSKYMTHSIFLLKKIVKYSDNIHGLGMGGLEEPLPKILKSFNLKSMLVPFFIYPISLRSFFELILKKKIGYSFKYPLYFFSVIDFMLKSFRSLKDKLSPKKYHYETFNDFDYTDTALWDSLNNCFDLIAIKDMENLNALYNKSLHKLQKIKIFENGQYLGWIILKTSKHIDSKHFNDCTTTTIVDLLCKQNDYNLFLKIIKNISRINKSDIILMNSTFEKFNDQLKKSKFIHIPSNFGFVYKTNLEFDISNSWITRADGDGPINL